MKIIFLTYILLSFDSINSIYIKTTTTIPVTSSNKNNTFIYNPEALNHKDALLWCANKGATLMNIHNQDDLNFALSINQNDNSFWVKKKLNFNKNLIYVFL